MSDRHWCQMGENWHTRGEDHTYKYEECVCATLCVPWESLAHCGMVAKGLPEVDGWGVLEDLITGVGQLVLPKSC